MLSLIGPNTPDVLTAAGLPRPADPASAALPLPGGGWRYHRDATLGPEYEAAMDGLFAKLVAEGGFTVPQREADRAAE